MTSLVLAALSVFGAPAGRVTVEPDVAAAAGSDAWIKLSRSAPDTPLSFTASFRKSAEALATLDRTFWRVSDPDSREYGKYWTQTEVAKLLAPPASAVELVMAHFVAADVSVAADLATIKMTAAEAELALGTEFHAFKHARTGVVLHRAHLPYSLPAPVAAVLDVVDNVLRLPRIDAAVRVATASPPPAPFPAETCGTSCSAAFVTPGVLAAQYNLGTPPAKAAANSSMSVSEFQGQMWDQANCDEFAEACKLGFNVTVNRQVGSNTPAQGPGSVEALLDIQYIKAIGGAIPLTDIYVDDYSLLTWCKTLIGLADAPLINSVSYGNDEKQQSGVAYMDSCNIQFQAAALRGLSILFASGDQGAYGRSGAGIFGNEPFHPDFPAGSPYITSVGGTNFATKGQLGSETAWSGSGGGFSNTFGIPDFQAAAVSAYKANFSSVLPPSKLWNNTGRGYPDVSALGGPVDGYCVNQGSDGFAGVAGTSAACPVTAAVFAKLNDLRSSAGSPALGFLNPWIYKNADAFNDVTSGVNNGGHKHGFTATKGWDPATGVGTPDFEKLRNVV